MVPGTEKAPGEESRKYNELGQEPAGAAHARVKLSSAGKIDGKLKIKDDDSNDESSNVTSVSKASEPLVLLDAGSDDSEHNQRNKGLWQVGVEGAQAENLKAHERLKNLKTKLARHDPYF